MMTDNEFNKLATKALSLMMENLGDNTSSGSLEDRYRHSVRVGRYMRKFSEDISGDYNFVKECVIAGLFHDIKKLSSNNHGVEAGKILEKDSELKSYKRAISAIKMHSLKALPQEVELDLVTTLLMDCDTLDKFNYDILCRMLSKASGLQERIAILNSKKGVLTNYKPKSDYDIVHDYFKKGHTKLNTFIENLEMDI